MTDPTLAELEEIIDEGLGTARVVHRALALIHQRRLYRATHASFERYALERFGISLTTAKRWAAIGKEQLAIEAGTKTNETQPTSASSQVSAGHSGPFRGAEPVDTTARDTTPQRLCASPGQSEYCHDPACAAQCKLATKASSPSDAPERPSAAPQPSRPAPMPPAPGTVPCARCGGTGRVQAPQNGSLSRGDVTPLFKR